MNHRTPKPSTLNPQVHFAITPKAPMQSRPLSHPDNRRMRILVISKPPIATSATTWRSRSVVAKAIVHELDRSRGILRENEIPLVRIRVEEFEGFETGFLDAVVRELGGRVFGVGVAVEVLGNVFADGGVE